MLVVATVCCSVLQADVLYDGSMNSLPGAQGWYYVTSPFSGALASQSVGGGATRLDTTAAIGESAGYFSDLPIAPTHPGVGVLDTAAGFALKFTAQLITEDHSLSANRAGFSVIVLDSNAKGVELGFWLNEIWAQTDSPLFTHSPLEQAAFDTTAALTQYTLTFQAGSYSLSAGGSPIFGGVLKDYSAFDHVTAGLPYDPYEQSNFVFFGDDTGSASADVKISRVELVPEPATAGVLLAGFAMTLIRRRRTTVAR
jgi:hypothetical protein